MCDPNLIIDPINPDDEDYANKNLYKVWLSAVGGVLYVFAQDESEVLDIAVDYAEEKGWEGYFCSDEEIDEMSDEEIEELICAGNHSRFLNDDNIGWELVDYSHEFVLVNKEIKNVSN